MCISVLVAAVDNGTALPNLPLGAGLDLHRPEFRHRPPKHLEEHLRWTGHDAGDVSSRRRVGDQRGVGSQQAPVLEHRPVVAEVKCQEAARVHLHQAVATGCPALVLPQVGGVGGVEGRVGAIAGTWVAVEAVGEGRAVGDANGVRTCSSGSSQKHISNFVCQVCRKLTQVLYSRS